MIGPNIKSSIGMEIAAARAQRGLSIRKLAELSGVPFGNIGKLERGEYNASIEIVQKIAKVLGKELTLV